MERKRAMLFVAWVLIAGAAPLCADSVRTVSVAGTAEIRVAPDTVIWKVAASETDPKDLFAAKRRVEARMNQLRALKVRLGIADADFEEGQMLIKREYDTDARGARGAFRWFVVSQQVVIRQTDIRRFDEFLDALAAGGGEVEYTFESSRIFDLRREARIAALRAAKEKASALAAAASAKVGRVVSVSEYLPAGQDRGFLASGTLLEANVAPDSSSGRILPGAIVVQATVYATFELE